MALNLQTLLTTARVQAKLSTPKLAMKARLAQQDAAIRAAEEHARSLAKRETLSRALSSEGVDAMRFRFLGENTSLLPRLAGLSLEQFRKEVDLLIRQAAIRRLSEMRRKEV